MKTNFRQLLYMKKQKNYQQGAAPIYLRITLGGKRVKVATGRECLPEKWNAKLGRAIGSKEEIKVFNIFLTNLQHQVYEAYRCLSEKGELITAEAIKNKVLGKSEKAHMLIEIFKDHNNKMAALVGKEFSTGTLQRYETSLRHTKEFINYKYGISNIDVKKIDHEFISEYDFYLRSVRKCSNNSAVKYISNFGKIIRICLSNGWITADPFANYKVKTIKRVFLSEYELQRVADKCFATDRLTQVRDVFLFCCYTGLAYADVKKLKMSQIEKGIDGEFWIFTNRQKTDERSAIPLLPMAIELIERYAVTLFV